MDCFKDDGFTEILLDLVQTELQNNNDLSSNTTYKLQTIDNMDININSFFVQSKMKSGMS
jgi:hypothetical protein